MDAPADTWRLSRRQAMSLVVASATSLIADNAHAARDASALPSNSSRSRNELSLVVPYAAGGPLDRAARKLTQETTALGNINVLNVAGDGGATGAAMVARAGAREPMLLMGAVATHAILPWLNPQLPYDPLRDFQPLTLVARMPHVLVMRSELAMQWRIYTPEDLLRFMSKHRQPLRYASAGNGSIGHIAGQWFQSLTQVPLQHLPFGGARPALSALLEGTADLMFDNIASALPHLRAGRLKAIGVTWRSPLPALPEVPSLDDSIKGMNLTTWFGIFATAGITDSQAKRWSEAFAQTLQRPDIQQYFDAMGVVRDDLRLQDFARLVQAEHARYGQLVKRAQIQMH
ncbi:tripartite tricarboxylate transporter substrate binding protein [Comamonas thiooxydans]|uniref:Bug family tripartite tricarboxylate transporter substrate binding protein n=1 Tax=Comamonas thiooxydans TaxID=363952 RepID=UPI000709DBC1|nr:tripartite tricarboxylate transporter substrate binding protein [Comamonas thiooxydans]